MAPTASSWSNQGTSSRATRRRGCQNPWAPGVCRSSNRSGSKLVAVQRTDLDVNDRTARELAIAGLIRSSAIISACSFSRRSHGSASVGARRPVCPHVHRKPGIFHRQSRGCYPGLRPQIWFCCGLHLFRGWEYLPQVQRRWDKCRGRGTATTFSISTTS